MADSITSPTPIEPLDANKMIAAVEDLYASDNPKALYEAFYEESPIDVEKAFERFERPFKEAKSIEEIGEIGCEVMRNPNNAVLALETALVEASVNATMIELVDLAKREGEIVGKQAAMYIGALMLGTSRDYNRYRLLLEDLGFMRPSTTSDLNENRFFKMTIGGFFEVESLDSLNTLSPTVAYEVIGHWRHCVHIAETRFDLNFGQSPESRLIHEMLNESFWAYCYQRHIEAKRLPADCQNEAKRCLTNHVILYGLVRILHEKGFLANKKSSSGQFLT